MKRRLRGQAMTPSLVERIRAALKDTSAIAEIRMFGGTCFTLNGNMLVGTMKDGSLLARVGEAREAEALARPGAGRMVFTGRQMRGYVIVQSAVLDDDALLGWIALSKANVAPMPPKQKKPPKRS